VAHVMGVDRGDRPGITFVHVSDCDFHAGALTLAWFPSKVRSWR
jgi:hypothetical protein